MAAQREETKAFSGVQNRGTNQGLEDDDSFDFVEMLNKAWPATKPPVMPAA